MTASATRTSPSPGSRASGEKRHDTEPGMSRALRMEVEVLAIPPIEWWL